MLPSGFYPALDPGFVFNYYFQFTMAIAASSLIGWQFGDLVNLFLIALEKASARQKDHIIGRIGDLFSLSFLGDVRQRVLQIACAVLAFCIIFSGFNVIWNFILYLEYFVIIFFVAIIVNANASEGSGISFFGLLDRAADKVNFEDFLKLLYKATLPVAIFLLLHFSHELGKSRAERILAGEKIEATVISKVGVIFAVTSAGIIFATREESEEPDSDLLFVLLNGDGEIVLSSLR